MDNTVGSANTDFCNFAIDRNKAYIIGLWCADGYHRTSSIGISNTDIDLVNKFRDFFLDLFSGARLKMRIYNPDNFLRRTKAYHLYVNSRPLLRKFREFKENPVRFISQDFIAPYFAGRFDGDGSVAKDFYRDCRIVYSKHEEAKKDKDLLEILDFRLAKIYTYKKAKTFCLYISRMETNKFLSMIYPYSVRLQKSVFVPRRDLITKLV